jgi:uncharacterized protein (TIGR03118 family)
MNRIRNVILPAAAAALVAVGATHALAASTRYQQINLVSDGTVSGTNPDANLVNGWGVAFNPNGPVWVSDNGTGRSTLYDGQGNINSLVVQIPSPSGFEPPGKPTGIVFNSSNDFTVTNGTTTGPSRFLFATEEGVIAGWAPNVDGTHALPAVQTPGAVYKGLALAGDGTGHLLYAADFFGGKIDVFDRNFNPVAAPGGFVDQALPPNFSPFNITAIQGDLYVTYAFRKPGDTDETAGQGLGIVDVFDAGGRLLRRVATRGKLNAPWGIALAPAAFGSFANYVLVGNFGDGTINAYDAHSGAFKGQLRAPNGRPLKIDGLWGLAFGNGVLSQPSSVLFFAAGPSDESHGLYGAIMPVPGPADDEEGDD